MPTPTQLWFQKFDERGHFERPRSILEDSNEVRYERLENVIMKNNMSMDVTPCSLVKVY
jgi:hypothetical protein